MGIITDMYKLSFFFFMKKKLHLQKWHFSHFICGMENCQGKTKHKKTQHTNWKCLKGRWNLCYSEANKILLFKLFELYETFS